jgi:hypothetical protein
MKFLIPIALALMTQSVLAVPVIDAKGTPLPRGATCRDAGVKRDFDKMMGFPHGRRGYIVDHVCALVVGGRDITENMQYQTIADSAVKDRVEDTPYGRKKWCTPLNSTPKRMVYNCK